MGLGIAKWFGLKDDPDDISKLALCAKGIGIVLKMLAMICELVFAYFVLQQNRSDLIEYEKKAAPMLNNKGENINGTIIHINYNNEQFTSTVNVDVFKSCFKIYDILLIVMTVASALICILQAARMCFRKVPIPFLWVPVVVCIELPLLCYQTDMLLARGIVTWQYQKWEIVMHIIFLSNLPFQTFVEVITARPEGICLALYVPPLFFVFVSMAYTPISVKMAGWKGFEKVTLDDLGKKMTLVGVEDIMVVLAEVGHVDQFVWCLLFLLFFLFIFCYCSESCKEENERACCNYCLAASFQAVFLQ